VTHKTTRTYSADASVRKVSWIARGAAPLLCAIALSSPAFAEDSTAALASSELASLRFNQDAQAAPAAAPKPDDASAAGGGDADLAKKLSNPVANLISVPLQLNYNEPYGPKDASNVTLNIQPVVPFSINKEWNLISRTILPVIYQGSPAESIDSEFGLGDITQSLFFSPVEPVNGWILGFGPVALIPTATNDALGSDQLGFGPTIVLLKQQDGWTYGALANQIWGVTDPDEGQSRVNAAFIQPFLSYTWKSATSLTLNAEASYDWTEDELTLPFNLMLAQVVRVGKQPIQLLIGGRYYADGPDDGPEWGLRFALTFLFPR
jgi:hypothetical protein